MRRLYVTSDRSLYFSVWRDCVIHSERKVRKGYLGKPTPPDFSYRVTAYNFQTTDEVVYRLRYAQEDEPLTCDYINYLGYWARKFFADEPVYVYSESDCDFVKVVSMPAVTKGARYKGNLIFSNKGTTSNGVEITQEFTLNRVLDNLGQPIIKEETMTTTLPVDTETVLTDFEKKPKYVVLTYDKNTGNQLSRVDVKTKKDLKALLQKASSVDAYRVAYKLDKVYSVELPIVEVGVDGAPLPTP